MADLFAVLAEVAKDIGIAAGSALAAYLASRRRSPDPAPRTSSASLPAIRLPGSAPPRPRILIVDDERSFGRVIRGALDHLDLEVDIAGSCAEARDLALRHPYRLIVVDLSLPDGEGISLLSELRTRMVIYSGASERELESARRLELADGVLGKDASLDALEGVVVEMTGAKPKG